MTMEQSEENKYLRITSGWRGTVNKVKIKWASNEKEVVGRNERGMDEEGEI